MKTRAFGRGISWPLAKADDAGVLEEAADDALDADVVGQAMDARAQAANAAHDQFDLHPGLAGAIEGVDHHRIDQRVQLGPDRAGLPALAFSASRAISLSSSRLQCHRRERQFFQLAPAWRNR